MPSFFQIKTFISYWLDAVDEHSLHSPFFYDFFTLVIKAKGNEQQFHSFEIERKKYLKSDLTIEVLDLGAGSQIKSNTRRKIADIARTSLSSPKYAHLYVRISKYFNCVNILELGTSLGITTLYLAKTSGTRVTTFEGSSEIATLAKASFKEVAATNIILIEGNIDTTLPSFLIDSIKIDMVFIDAHHRYASTLRYFQQLSQKAHHQTIIIIDDIHYSAEMEKAWHEVRHHPLVYGSIDLYRCGILFFDPSLNKQHFVMQF